MCRKLGIILWKNCFSGVLKMTSNDTQPRRPLFQEIYIYIYACVCIMEVELLWRCPNAPSVALRGGLRLLRLAEFVRYNPAAIGGPSKRQPMNSLVSSCLGSTCYAQTTFARYWLAFKAAANELTRIKLPRLNANLQSYQIDV